MSRLFTFELISLEWANDIAAITQGEEATVEKATFCRACYSSFEQWDGAAIVGRPSFPLWDRPDTLELLSLVPKTEEIGMPLLADVLRYLEEETTYRRLILPPFPFRVLDVMRERRWRLAGSVIACSRKDRRNGRTHAGCCQSRFCWQLPAVPGPVPDQVEEQQQGG